MHIAKAKRFRPWPIEESLTYGKSHKKTWREKKER